MAGGGDGEAGGGAGGGVGGGWGVGGSGGNRQCYSGDLSDPLCVQNENGVSLVHCARGEWGTSCEGIAVCIAAVWSTTTQWGDDDSHWTAAAA